MAKRTKVANAAESMRVDPDYTQKKKPRMEVAATSEIETVEIDDLADVEVHGSEEPLERAIVERGHSIHAPIPGKRRIVGWVEGNKIFGPVMQAYGPGEEVMLPRSEVKRLKETGHLVDPNRKHAAPSDHIQLIDKAPPAEGARVVEQ